MFEDPRGSRCLCFVPRPRSLHPLHCRSASNANEEMSPRSQLPFAVAEIGTAFEVARWFAKCFQHVNCFSYDELRAPLFASRTSDGNHSGADAREKAGAVERALSPHFERT